jgi:hypothetical protein
MMLLRQRCGGVRSRTINSTAASAAVIRGRAAPTILSGIMGVARSWQRRLVRMKVVCAWCEREGQPAYLGECEPYDNPATTHGLCQRHQKQALEALPSQSFPDAEMLIVVRPNDTDLYEYLVRRFAGVPGVRVILDRRQSDRPVDEREHNDRRIRQGTVSSLGYTVVRFKRPRPPAAAGTMSQESLRLLIRQKIRDGLLPRGGLPAAIAGRPGDGSRCRACDQIITASALMMLVPLTERPSPHAEETVALHGDCFLIWTESGA